MILRAADLLDRLSVPCGGVLYVQSSMDWLGRLGFTASEVMAALRERAGTTGTLVMPAYPFLGTHLSYLQTTPRYDVRRTPARVGLLNEMLRRTPGAVRSLDPDYPIVAQGPAAVELAGPAPATEDPFGSDSPYARMLQRVSVLVGLGVSLNTNSFIHRIDSACQALYRRPVYGCTTFDVPVTDYDGRTFLVKRRPLLPSFQTLIAPGAIVDQVGLHADVFQQYRIGEVQLFRCMLPAWADWASAHARERSEKQRLPCWLHRLEAGTMSPGAASAGGGGP
jgi:aminoglycoside N3'-acetyltransferase